MPSQNAKSSGIRSKERLSCFLKIPARRKELSYADRSTRLTATGTMATSALPPHDQVVAHTFTPAVRRKSETIMYPYVLP